jgi:hypothetical protein
LRTVAKHRGYGRSEEGNSASTISNYYATLNPNNISPRAETYFSHHNHAKIIRCGKKAYVGSANFTMGSLRNFEAGYITDDWSDIRRIDNLIDDIRSRAIPYFRVGPSLHVHQLLQFAADTPWLVEQVQLTAFDEVETYGDETEFRLKLNNFRIPPRVAESLKAALRAAHNLEAKEDGDRELNKSEDARTALGLSVTIDGLLEAVGSINSEDELPRKFNSSDTHGMLNDYLLSENPAEDPEYLEAVKAAEEENENERTKIAKEQMSRFLRDLKDASDEIFAAVHPNTPKKKDPPKIAPDDSSGLF